MIFRKLLFNELLSDEKSICFVVHKGSSYWILDHKYNFSLDAEKDYLGFLNKGHITDDQYGEACKEFRGGILKLTSENFEDYMNKADPCVLTIENLKTFFEAGNIHLLRKLENYYLYESPLNEGDTHLIEILASRLPKFYINFDRKIYAHMDYGRFHEKLAYADWFSKYFDFNFLIPDKERYWAENGDYWKLRFTRKLL